MCSRRPSPLRLRWRASCSGGRSLIWRPRLRAHLYSAYTTPRNATKNSAIHVGDFLRWYPSIPSAIRKSLSTVQNHVIRWPHQACSYTRRSSGGSAPNASEDIPRSIPTIQFSRAVMIMCICLSPRPPPFGTSGAVYAAPLSAPTLHTPTSVLDLVEHRLDQVRAPECGANAFVIDVATDHDGQTYLVAPFDGEIRIEKTKPAIVSVSKRR